ncbi:MAG: glycosyltransferase [Fibrobacterota bacterium]|nr:glycosyltransferase [Fibrobacterota bacterium]QQS03810.1 MAG: glycosyltransferase [Fibrobacterota bacterium]
MSDILPNHGDLSKPMVTVCSLSFNHAPFVRQTMDGFLAQTAPFKIQFIIHDDASTDGTQEILKEYNNRYPDRFEFILQETNIWSQKRDSFREFILPKAKGKYIALCECDDYWTDPEKLVKEITYLENHPEVGMVHTDFDVDCPENHPYLPFLDRMRRRRRSGQVFCELMIANFISTPTVVIRSDIFLAANEKFDALKIDFEIDFLYWLEIAKDYEIHYIPSLTTMYRVHSGGLSHNESYMKKTVNSIRLFHLMRSIRKSHLKVLDQENINRIGRLFVDLIRLETTTREQKIRLIKNGMMILPIQTSVRMFVSWFRQTLFPK